MTRIFLELALCIDELLVQVHTCREHSLDYDNSYRALQDQQAEVLSEERETCVANVMGADQDNASRIEQGRNNVSKSREHT